MRFRQKQPKPAWRVALEYVLCIGAAVGLALLIVKYVAVRSIVDGTSMEPFVDNRDNVIVEKISYYFHDPERYDVVVFELKEEPDVHYIKRIIGLPGETVQIIDGIVHINGEPLTDDVYCSEKINNAYMAQNPVVLGENEYFMMGDNRNRSKDSRAAEVGPVNRSQFVGKAWIRFWPLSGIKYVGR